MLNYKQIWHEVKATRWLIKFNLTVIHEDLIVYDTSYSLIYKMLRWHVRIGGVKNLFYIRSLLNLISFGYVDLGFQNFPNRAS